MAKKRRFLRKVLLITIALVAFATGVLFAYPDFNRLKKENPKDTAFMRHAIEKARDEGKTLRIKQQWVGLSRISPSLVSAVLIGEDDKFYQHEGFDYEALQKAIEKDLKAGKLKAGGSTISQQLVKNLYLSPSRNPLRKLVEAIWTWRMERALTKRRILEIYLNVAQWGEGIYGIEAAARKYYGKSASALDAHESARLAAVLPNPVRYNPLGDSRYVQNRAAAISKVMQQRGHVDREYEQE